MKYNYLFEVWRPVRGYEGRYLVSNFGRVRSLDFVDRFNRMYRGKDLTLTLSCYGYYVVSLCLNGNEKQCRVNRLVAEAFIPNPNNLPFVNHKDENKINNFVWVNPDGTVDPEKSNLEWCTPEYNTIYGTGRERMAKKQKNRTDLSRAVGCYTLNNELVAIYPSQMEAYRATGIWNVSIAACCKGKLKTSGGYIWKYIGTNENNIT